MALDVLLVAFWDWGLRGAAIATVVASLMGSVLPLLFFFKNRSLLWLARPVWEGRQLFRAMINGSSEMVNSLAIAFVTFLFNLQMMAYVGEKGVAAISSSLYIQDLFLSAIMGFSMGVGPVISYFYGAGNTENLRKIVRICLVVIVTASFVLFAGAELFAAPLVNIFAGDDHILRKMALAGFRLFSIGFLFSSFNIFASGFFTSLCNGKISTLIAFLRAFIFQSGAILLLPLILGVNGIWFAVPLAEMITALLGFFLIMHYRTRYHYL
jgi:Na+-driven multidrug efflux pump